MAETRGELLAGSAELAVADERGVDAGGGEETKLFGQRRDQGESELRAQDAGRVGIEGDGERADAERLGASDDFGDHPAVAAMDAVEVADGGHDGAERGGKLGEMTIDLHEALFGSILSN